MINKLLKRLKRKKDYLVLKDKTYNENFSLDFSCDFIADFYMRDYLKEYIHESTIKKLNDDYTLEDDF